MKSVFPGTVCCRTLLAGLAACLIVIITGCTLIYIEGDSNTVRDIEGHSGTVAVPESAFDRSLTR
ncbi:hypothetical protein R75461_07802 [Paraburkholderia nemoris]|nr:hypothetical protein R75461_07802 [Paraburkholderia nemoris]